MMKTIMFMITVITLVMIIMSIIMITCKKSIMDMQKSTPFECGFNPMSMKRMPFSIHFFLIAVIFLIFDIEIIIIIPMLISMKTSIMAWWMITSMSFVMILIMGLYIEWKNGMLNWTN